MLELKSFNKISDFEKGPIRRSLFSNGAVSLVHKANGFSGAKVQLHFIAGSIFENEKQEGISHIIEHLVFKDGENGLIKKLELMGAGISAYTYKENVCFELTCASRKLKEMLPLFLDKFMNLDFSEKELTNEKKVIIQELKDDLDDHETMAIEYSFSKNFNQKIGHPIGGKISQIKKYKREQINHYYKKYYTPNRMILSVVSGENNNFIEEEFKAALEKNYSFKASTPFRLKAKDSLKKLKHFKAKSKKKMENALLLYSFDGPSINSKYYYDFIILDELLFEGLSCLFFKKLREETALVYGYGSSINCFANSGNYQMIFNSSKKNLNDLRKKCSEVFLEIQEMKFNDNEINLIKNRFLDSWELSFDDLEERAEFMAGTEIYQLNEYSLKTVKNKIKNIDANSINKMFTKIFKSGFSELVYSPK